MNPVHRLLQSQGFIAIAFGAGPDVSRDFAELEYPIVAEQHQRRELQICAVIMPAAHNDPSQPSR
jgi:hypothetical protein